jgi:hypothetical protein
VRNEQIGEAKPILQVFQQIHHLRLNRHVQRGDGLVADDEDRLSRQCAGDPDPLPLRVETG